MGCGKKAWVEELEEEAARVEAERLASKAELMLKISSPPVIVSTVEDCVKRLDEISGRIHTSRAGFAELSSVINKLNLMIGS
jgi:hypothetical protein